MPDLPGGAVLAGAKTKSKRDLGNDIILVGLAIQVVFFGFFIITTAIFHRRILQQPTRRYLQVPWQRYIIVLYIASALIMVRSVFRLIEYGMGFDGALQSSEVYIYVFDASLMFIVVCTFVVYPPHTIISRARKDGMGSFTADEGERWTRGREHMRLSSSVSGVSPMGGTATENATATSTETLSAVKVELQPMGAPSSGQPQQDWTSLRPETSGHARPARYHHGHHYLPPSRTSRDEP
jgi:hypothetical protein